VCVYAYTYAYIELILINDLLASKVKRSKLIDVCVRCAPLVENQPRFHQHCLQVSSLIFDNYMYTFKTFQTGAR